MEARIIEVNKINNANINISFELLNDKGEVLLKDTRGFICLKKTEEEALADIKQSFKNIMSTHLEQNESKLHDSIKKFVGTSIGLD